MALSMPSQAHGVALAGRAGLARRPLTRLCSGPARTPLAGPGSEHRLAVRTRAQAAETATSADLQLACPICHEPFAGNAYSCRCERCRSSFTASGPYLDLTIGSTVGTGAYRDQPWAGTQIFRSPLVSFAYERGWRQSFAWAGFPGVKEEARIALEFLRPAWGSPVVDMSCGSGLFTRELIASAKFPRVVAADFSESMLRQADEYLAAMGTESRGQVQLVRVDVSRQPFATGSVAGMHAGAAIHCWPAPLAAAVEISRVLAPGGVFVASTFMVPTAPLDDFLGPDLARPLHAMAGMAPGERSAYRWWSEEELRDLFEAVGLRDFRRRRFNRFILFAVSKPPADGASQ